MTHTNDAQRRPVRLDQYVNQDPQLIFETRLVFKARLLFEEIRYPYSLEISTHTDIPYAL